MSKFYRLFALLIVLSGSLQAANYVIISPILCNGDSATIAIIGTSGFPPYTNADTSKYGAGAYTVYVTDSIGNIDTLNFTISQPTPIFLNSIVLSPPSFCYGDSVLVSVEKTGGAGFALPVDSFKIPGNNPIISVADSNGCIGYDTVFINQPSKLYVNVFVVEPILCHGDTATISLGATGGTPPYFNNGLYYFTAGTYTGYITDLNGCIDSTIISVTEPPAISTNIITSPDNGTGNGTAAFNITGGNPPYTFFIDSVEQFTNVISNLSANTYNYAILDSNFCLITGSFTINLKFANSLNNYAINHFSIYPNPITNQQLFIQSGVENVGDITVSIFNILGQLVYKKNLIALNNSNKTFSMQLPTQIISGVYTLKLDAKNVSEYQIIQIK